MLSFKQFMTEKTEESGHTELVQKFLNHAGPEYNTHVYGKRDNCGFACWEMAHWAEKRGIKLNRVQGEFKADRVVDDKQDFSPDMKREFRQSGLDFNKREHRKQWLDNHPRYKDEWKNIPHYWLEDEHGTIHDPSGHAQIIKGKFAKDLHPSRYFPNKES